METERVGALDSFRGLTVALMILVNWPGCEADSFTALLHSPWNGCRLADVIFPFFVFITGVGAWFSFKKYSHLLTREAFWKIVRRVFLLFLVGILLNMFPFCHINWITLKAVPTMGEPEFWENLRILGVLQRIALAWGFGVFFCLAFHGKAKPIAFISALLLVLYWCLFYIFPEEPAPLSLMSNMTRKFDLWALGASHLYHGELYHEIAFDPESILGTISATVNVLIGFLAGRAIDPLENGDYANPSHPVPGWRTIGKLLLAASALIGVALLWDRVFPINKPLWTSSYVLFTCGLALTLLAWAVWLVDKRKNQALTWPLAAFGANPLFLYVLAWCLYDTFMQWVFTRQAYVDFYHGVLIPYVGKSGASLVVGLAFLALISVFAFILYSRKIFIRI